MIEDEPYTYDELDELFRRDGNNDYIGLSVIDGLIAALVAGPATVPPREWLPLIYADKMPSTVKGHPESRSKATIMARYAEVEQILALHPAGYQPIFMHDRGRFICWRSSNSERIRRRFGSSRVRDVGQPTLMVF